MKQFKKVSKAGGITIPQIMRHELNIPKGAAVEVETVEDALIIRKHIPTCILCGSADDVVIIDGTELCSKCLERFNEKAKEEEHDRNDNYRVG